MANALGSQQKRIVEVVIRLGAIPKRFARMEYERYIHPDLFLACLELQEWFDVVNNRLQHVFVANEIEASNEVRKLLF